MIHGDENLNRAARLAKEEGMARADAGATDAEKADFEQAVRAIAIVQPHLTVDDVKKKYPGLTISDNASGPAMKRLAAQGVLIAAGRVLSKRETGSVAHRVRYVTRWQSAIHAGYEPDQAVIREDDLERVAHLAHELGCRDAEVFNVALDLLERAIQ